MKRILETFSMSYVRGKKSVQLTPSEYKILYLLSHRSSNLVEISKMLEIKKNTVKTHVFNLKEKLISVGEKDFLTGVGKYSIPKKIEVKIKSRFERKAS